MHISCEVRVAGGQTSSKIGLFAFAKSLKPFNMVSGEFKMINRVNQSTSYSIEHELFAISASKVARQIMEELGTGYSRQNDEGDDTFPHGGEEPYDITEGTLGVNRVMTLGDSLSRVCWGSNAKDNRAYYIADTGHVVTVKPKNEANPNAKAVKNAERFLEKWQKENNWKLRQSEVSHRCDRHGEVFDLLYYDDDGILRVYFAEPTDLEEDPNSQYQDSNAGDNPSPYPFIDLFGVRRTNDIRYRPVAYFIESDWFPDLRYVSQMGAVPAPESLNSGKVAVQHRKRNVLANDPRGLTLFWPVREEMIFAKKLLANLMRVSTFQAAYGAIRTINASQGADQVRSWLASQQTGDGSAGQRESFDFPAASVVTVPGTITYEFPETGAGNSNQIEVLTSLLRACSAGMKIPEFMLSADVSQGNFASTLVSEGPFHKGMRFEQSQMVAEDEVILMQALRYAALRGVEDITDADIDDIVLHIKPPRVQTRNRAEDFDVNKELYDRGELSGKTLLAEEGKERESEQAQRQSELKNELDLPKGSSLATTASMPGPVTKKKTDPMKEKGVSKGNPEKIIQK